MQTLARSSLCADVIAAPVVLGCSAQGLVDVADPVAQELERRQLLLIDRVRRCQDREIALTTHSPAMGHGSSSRSVASRGRLTKCSDCTLPRPIGPVARRAKRGELLILLGQRDHALAGAVVQLSECHLADCLVAEAAPGEARRLYRAGCCRFSGDASADCSRRHGNVGTAYRVRVVADPDDPTTGVGARCAGESSRSISTRSHDVKPAAYDAGAAPVSSGTGGVA